MSKRYLDTEFFNDSWVDELTPESKLFFIYFITKCNAGGILDLNKKKCKESVGCKDINNIFKEYGRALIPLRDNYIFMPKFVKYQYGKLNINSGIHARAIKELEKFNLIDENLELIISNEVINQPLFDMPAMPIKSEIKIKKVVFKNVDETNNYEELMEYWEQNKQGKKYKNENSRNTAMNSLIKMSNNDFSYAKEIIEYAVVNTWMGFRQINNGDRNARTRKQGPTTEFENIGEDI